METMASFCGYEENAEELKNLLVQTIVALETARREAKEDMRRNEEHVNQLLYFLKVACEERDEARDQLQKFLSISPPAEDVSPVLPPESPMYLTLSDTISLVSGVSPVDSLLDMVSSPDLDNFADSSTLGVPVPMSSCVWPQECIGNFAPVSSHAVAVAGTDTASGVMDSLVRGKTLPEKGKLLQTVMEAGPLLQTLIFSVSLPQWRNPPPPPPPPQPLPVGNHLSYGSSQMYSAPTLLQNRFVSGKR